MTIIFKHNFVPSQKAAPYRQTQGLNYKSILSITLILIFSLFSSLFPQSLSPKREFRGIWIATLENIDWPSANNLSPEQQKKEFITIINRLQKDKFNAVFIQIRPSSDALYESSLEPWSEWLTGKQGRSPSPDYDPLSFMIDECHKRGIEIHAWFNPFRSVMNIHTSNISPQHVSIRHPDWNVTYGEYKWLNPGLPEVRNYVLKIVMDVVRRYPVDGVHFDDYFYPYPQKNIKFNDAGTFTRYSRGIKKLTDWRRDNINLFVKSVSDSIRKVKPGLKFGISPPGVWKNKSGDFAGSYTAASESFNSNYADSRKWLKESWIDYLVPQLYWHIGNFHADYQILTDWWNENAYGKNIYIGQSAYKIGTDNNHEWSDPSQLPSQIKLNRLLNNIKGNVFFNTNSVLKNPLGFEDSLRNNYYKYFALTPNINNNINSLPQPPLDPAYKNVNGQILLSWNMHLKNLNNDTASYFVIYSFDQNDKIDIAQGEKIAAVLYGSETSWLDSRRKINPSGKTYIITAIDKYGNESNDKCRITIPPVSVPENQIAENITSYNPHTMTVKYDKNGLSISVHLASPGFITLKVFDVLGNEIRRLLYAYQKAGNYLYLFPPNEQYQKPIVVQLKTDGYYCTKKNY